MTVNLLSESEKPAIQFINNAGEVIKDIREMLPVIGAGLKPVKTKLFFRNECEDVVELSFGLKADPRTGRVDERVRIIDYTRQLDPLAIGWIELESSSDTKTKRAISLQLSCEATLTGPPAKGV